MTTAQHTTRVVIIGGGFSGIGMAIRLRQRGITDFVILERASEAGGTWRDNSYPGCACDVQSSLYSFSFAANPEWSHTYAPQAEIWQYLRTCAAKFDIDRHFVFSQTVTGAEWDDAMQRWTVRTSRGDAWSARVVIMASGALSEPMVPRLPGLDSFTGTTFHSAQWRHDIDLTGKRVGVIGTGASAIQFVPHIQPRVAHLDVFQRTPPWIMPRRDRAVADWTKSLYRAFPPAQRLVRGALYAQRELLHVPFRHRGAGRVVEWVSRRHLHSQVRDSVLRDALTPRYQIGCKRILVSDDFYPAMQQPNVALVVRPVTGVIADGVMTDDGVLHPADVIIFGTGFRPTDPPLAPTIIGRDGVSLADAWRGSPAAYMGTSVPGFPNFFMLLGPNTGLGHSSVMLMSEAQMEHVLRLVSLMEARNAATVEPMSQALTRYVTWLDARLSSTTWNAGGCNSWYLDRTGRNSTLWPDGVGRFVRTVSRVNADDYQFQPAHASAAEGAR